MCRGQVLGPLSAMLAVGGDGTSASHVEIWIVDGVLSRPALTRLPKANSDSDGLVSHCPAEFNVPIPHKRE